MERNRRVWSQFLKLICTVTCITSCVHEVNIADRNEVDIRLSAGSISSKALLPDEELISDASLMIFDENGDLEKHFYLHNGNNTVTASLLIGTRYSILACVNFGYDVCLDRIEDKESVSFYMAYPDEYREGIPMSAHIEGILIEEDTVIDIELERMMACISIKMDRSRLSDGVDMKVRSVRIGNCPKSVRAFSESKVSKGDECFNIGFSHNDIECAPLNLVDINKMSESISLYMLENMQGRFSSESINMDDAKVFEENDPRRETCSYIEIDLDYSYQDFSSTETPLIYRFYLGENLNSLDVERNCHYSVTICPENEGLSGSGWRVDKSGVRFNGIPGIKQYPSDYIVGNVGDVIHIGCDLTPSNAPFDIGIDYLEADKRSGIYEYSIDPDGHGVTLTLTGPGRGLIYMEAGDPINDAALFLIEVNLPYI